MRDIPIIFPISLVVILVLTFFTGAYAISENALPCKASRPSIAPLGRPCCCYGGPAERLV